MNQRPAVLLIEPGKIYAHQMEILLRRAGYSVHVTHDGGDGWYQACQISPRIILLNRHAPTMDGFRVLFFLKQARITAGIPVVMLIALEQAEDIEEALALGADGYLFADHCIYRHDSTRHMMTILRHLVHTGAGMHN